MLSTSSLFFVAGAALVAAVLAFVFSYRAMKAAAAGHDTAVASMHYVQKHNAADVSLVKLTELETGLTELTDSYHALLDSHKKLRSRIGMREVRERRGNSKTAPPGETYEQKKARLREEAKNRGYNV